MTCQVIMINTGREFESRVFDKKTTFHIKRKLMKSSTQKKINPNIFIRIIYCFYNRFPTTENTHSHCNRMHQYVLDMETRLALSALCESNHIGVNYP